MKSLQIQQILNPKLKEFDDRILRRLLVIISIYIEINGKKILIKKNLSLFH